MTQIRLEEMILDSDIRAQINMMEFWQLAKEA